MSRYIDIDKMNKWTEVDQKSCSRENCASTSYDCNECYYNNGGAEDVAPVIHAKWEIEEPDWIMMCSNCGNPEEIFYPAMISNYLYCPNCGAKMDKE